MRVVVGQYDFILGSENLNKTINNAEFNILGSNLNSENYLSNVKPYIIKNIKGVNIGVLGIVNSKISELVPASKIKGISFDFEINAIKKWVPQM